MTAVWVFFRAELRGRWRSWLALAVLAGLFGGVVIAVAAGARRTGAAYPSLLTWSRSPDDLISLGSGQGPTFATLPVATVERLPQVTAAGGLTTFTALEPAALTVMAPVNGAIPGSLWRRKLLAGSASRAWSARSGGHLLHRGAVAAPGGRPDAARGAAWRHR